MKVRLERGMTMTKDPLRSHDMYFNRELSWLEFNDRVLREGLADDVPLLERVKFLAIVSSNLDEFFLVRVAGLMQARAEGVRRRDPCRHDPGRAVAGRQPARPSHDARAAAKGSRRPWQTCPAGISVVPSRRSGPTKQRQFLQTHFAKEILPVLTPLAVQELHPPPRLPGLQWHVRRGAGRRRRATRTDRRDARSPADFPLGPPAAATDVRLARLEDVIAANVGVLFPGAEIAGHGPVPHHPRRRRAVERDETDDLLEAVERAVLTRQRRPPVRLQVSPAADPRIRALARRAG